MTGVIPKTFAAIAGMAAMIQGLSPYQADFARSLDRSSDILGDERARRRWLIKSARANHLARPAEEWRWAMGKTKGRRGAAGRFYASLARRGR